MSEKRPFVGRHGLRLAILIAFCTAALTVAVLVKRGERRSQLASSAVGAPRDGRAAIRAPEGPMVPANPNGVRLTGFVIDGSGAPVVGAEVSAEIERGTVDRALVPVDAIPTKDARGVVTIPPPKVPVLWGNALPHDVAVAGGVAVAAPTDRDGRFAILGLDPGRYRLRVTGPGLLSAEVRYVPVPSDATRIVVARQVAIEGTVIDGGKPAANVTIALRGDAIGGAIEARSSLTGGFAFKDLPEGRYQLYAYQGSLAARAVRVSRLGTGPFASVELRLEAAAIVVGRILDREEGTGVAAAIELRPSGDDQAPRYARSGSDGVFRIEGVPNGRWIADAFAPGYLSTGGVELEAGRGVPELVLSRGATVEGRIVDRDDKPIANAVVRALGSASTSSESSELVEQDMLRRFSGRIAAPIATGESLSADPQLIERGELGVMVGPIPPIPPPGAQIARQAIVDPTGAMAALSGDPAPLPVDPARTSLWITGPDGHYRIRGLGKGTVTVLATAPSFAEGRSKEVAIEIGQVVAGIDVVLTPGTIVVGKVTDQHGVPVIGARISARPGVGAAIDAFTDEGGEYKLGPVTGKLELVATAYGHGDDHRTIDLALVRGATAAQRTESFVLVVADATLAGTLDDMNGTAVSGGDLEVISGAGEGRHAIVASDGTFSIDMLPAGPLRVRIRHPDYPDHELETVASTAGRERVRLRLPLGGAIEGAVIEATSGTALSGITITGARDGEIQRALASGTRPGPGAETMTDKLGRWRLGPLVPGHWKLAIKIPGYLPLSHEVDVPVARTPGTTSVHDVRLELARGALVGGTVRDARGQRISGAAIVIRVASGTGPTALGISDVAGEFRIRDAPTGDLEITATSGDRHGITKVTVRPGDEVLGLSVDVGR